MLTGRTHCVARNAMRLPAFLAVCVAQMIAGRWFIALPESTAEPHPFLNWTAYFSTPEAVVSLLGMYGALLAVAFAVVGVCARYDLVARDRT